MEHEQRSDSVVAMMDAVDVSEEGGAWATRWVAYMATSMTMSCTSASSIARPGSHAQPTGSEERPSRESDH